MESISEKLYSRLLQVEQSAAVAILLGALDEMQGYNGQTRTQAICTFIGATETDNGWVLPPVQELNERFT